MALNVTLTTQAPASGTYPTVTPTGSGITAPGDGDWSVSNAGSDSGDLLEIDISALQTAEDYRVIEYYEAAIEEDGAESARIVRIPYGRTVSKKRYLPTTTASTAQRVRIRSVQGLYNCIKISGAPPADGASLTQAATGATADVVEDIFIGVVLENVTGVFDSSTISDGTSNYTPKGPAFPASAAPLSKDEVRSEWSNPVEVTPATGTPSVTISASTSTPIQGQTVFFSVAVSGFDYTNYEIKDALHALHFHWTSDETARSYTALGNSYFESDYGAGQNNACEGFTRDWVYAPHTTGSVDVSVTVRDRSGNSATDTLTLTVAAPTTDFSDAEIFAVSATSRIPSGTSLTTGDIYSDLDAAILDIPASGKALILLDAADSSHGITSGGDANFSGVAADRIAVMPYDASGVGTAASARVSIDWGLGFDSATVIVHGVDCLGPFDPTDPYSDGSPGDGISAASSTTLCVDSCKVNGWRRNFLPPPTYYLTDIESTDYFDYAIQQGDPLNHALAGCYIYHNPNAWDGDPDTDARFESTAPFFVDHTNYRASRPAGRRSFSKSVFFTTVGWNATLCQLPLRMFGGAQSYPYDIHFSECIIESRNAEMKFECTSAAAGNFEAPQNICMDKCRLIIGGQPRGLLAATTGPLTLRNSIGIFPDKDGELLGSGAEALVYMLPASAAGEGPQSDATNQQFVIENCTGVRLATSARANTYSTFSITNSGNQAPANSYPNIEERNNILHAPNLSSPITVSNLNAATQYTPLCIGTKYWDDDHGQANGADALTWNINNNPPDTTKKNEPEMTATFEPSTGSSAFQSATGSIPYDDFLSRVRPTGTASKGAFDPGGT